MLFLDFHHHKLSVQNGIYNLPIFEDAPKIPFSAGIHPKDIIEDMGQAKKWLVEMIKNENCKTIGECGLDGLAASDIKHQEEIFLWQIKLANDYNKPLIIHCVRKHYELIPFKKLCETPFIVHGFNKNKNVAKALLQNDFYLSFGKALLQSVSLQEIIKNLPENKFFLETDEACFNIEELYQKVAEIRNIPMQKIADQMKGNLELIIQ